MNGKGIYANSEIELEGYFENDNFVRPLQWFLSIYNKIVIISIMDEFFYIF